MDFKIFQKDYIQYLKNAYLIIHNNKEYITDLDSKTGDGDHWVNINMGFKKLMDMSEELEKLSFEEMFKKIGMTMMSGIGGSSGILYGGAYLSASKVVSGKEFIDKNTMKDIFYAQLTSMMDRGKCKPGDKTMIDPLYMAYNELSKNIDNDNLVETLVLTKQKAQEGTEATKYMKAVKGRASYQVNKGVGHLDPGAVTMLYQIEELINMIINTLQ